MNTLARIAKLKEQEKNYKAQVKEWEDERKALERELPLGLVSEGDFVAEVKETVRFDARRAKEVLPEWLYDEILVPKPDTTTAKKVLTGDEYAACQAPVGISVTFKKD